MQVPYLLRPSICLNSFRHFRKVRCRHSLRLGVAGAFDSGLVRNIIIPVFCYSSYCHFLSLGAWLQCQALLTLRNQSEGQVPAAADGRTGPQDNRTKGIQEQQTVNSSLDWLLLSTDSGLQTRRLSFNPVV